MDFNLQIALTNTEMQLLEQQLKMIAQRWKT